MIVAPKPTNETEALIVAMMNAACPLGNPKKVDPIHLLNALGSIAGVAMRMAPKDMAADVLTAFMEAVAQRAGFVADVKLQRLQ